MFDHRIVDFGTLVFRKISLVESYKNGFELIFFEELVPALGKSSCTCTGLP
jgi:hypothetical protein